MPFRGVFGPGPRAGWATARLVLFVVIAMEAASLSIPVTGRGRSKRTGRRFARALQSRNREAIEGVHEEYAPTVLGYLINVIGDRGRAEDVHQQVFLEVWQRAPDYDPGRASLLTWIMTIARSRAVDELRRRVPEPRDPDSSTTLALTADDDPERSPDALIERWRVAHMLTRLRGEEAELLRMRFYDGLSQPEIAERTDIPLGTVKMRMVSALERLRELIEAEEL
jgi:RNA polymerase sigma-70 factor, ECF subfamily